MITINQFRIGIAVAAFALTSAFPQTVSAFGGGRKPSPPPLPPNPQVRSDLKPDYDLITGPVHGVTTIDMPDIGATKYIPQFEGDHQRRGVVIIVQGWGSSRSIYGRLAKLIASRGFTVATYDLLGQGQNLPADERYRNTPIAGGGHFGSYVTQLDFMVRKFAPTEPVTLIGHSWGGAISLRYTMENPNRVKRLMGVSPYTGLPFTDAWEGKEVFRQKYLGGIFRGKANLKIKETFQDLAARLSERRELWPREILRNEFADLIAKRIRVHVCIKFIIGNRCSDKWVSVKSSDMRHYFGGEGAFDSLTIEGWAPRYLSLINFVEAENLLRTDKRKLAALKGKKIDLLVATERDPLTPLDTVRPFAKLAADSGATVLLGTFDRKYVDELIKHYPYPQAAGHLLIYHPEVERIILSRLIELN